MEAHAFMGLWKQDQKRPNIYDYRRYISGTIYPSVEELVEKWGSYQNAFIEFQTLYRKSVYPVVEISDYLLGCLITHAKLVRNIRAGGRSFLRFVLQDREHIEHIRAMLGETSVYRNTRRTSSWYVRCYDESLLGFWEFHDLNEHPEAAFRDTADFVRGYIETHSHFGLTPGNKRRLTLVGPLVPQCRDFLVKLGASKTTVFHANRDEKLKRMNVHSMSLVKVRDALYPDGCDYYAPIREEIYKVFDGRQRKKSDRPR